MEMIQIASDHGGVSGLENEADKYQLELAFVFQDPFNERRDESPDRRTISRVRRVWREIRDASTTLYLLAINSCKLQTEFTAEKSILAATIVPTTSRASRLARSKSVRQTLDTPLERDNHAQFTFLNSESCALYTAIHRYLAFPLVALPLLLPACSDDTHSSSTSSSSSSSGVLPPEPPRPRKTRPGTSCIPISPSISRH